MKQKIYVYVDLLFYSHSFKIPAELDFKLVEQRSFYCSLLYEKIILE